MAFAYHYPDRINKLVWGAGHIGTSGGYRNEYLISNYTEEGVKAAREAAATRRRRTSAATWSCRSSTRRWSPTS